VLFGAELFLRFGRGTYTTYLERNEGGKYRPLYDGGRPTWILNYTRNIEFTHRRPEFAYPRRTNSLGLCEREFPDEKPAGEFRVIALGDSYTEGVGTPYEETWLKVVERRLQEQLPERRVQAFNAGISGISGSDPLYEYVLLRDQLVRYRPDLVLVAINTSDISDVMIRGGSERFLPDGTTRFTRRPPAWEPLYGISYLFRHVIHDLLGYDYLFVRAQELEAEHDKAIEHIVGTVAGISALGRERGFALVVVLHPDNWEARTRAHTSQMVKLGARLRTDPRLPVIDVLGAWVASGLFERASADSLYWPIDGHNNSKGYAAFGEAVADALAALEFGG
jgi:lysophospholipase L1-like esterase